jgi:amino-acid N-acetyltransferase
LEDSAGDLTYGRGTAGDLSEVLALLALCGLPFDDVMADQMVHFVLCRSGGALVGTVGLEPSGEIALLRSLAVAPALRGRRIGHALWRRASEHARQGGIEHLFLLTTTAQALFARWGFRQISRETVPPPIQETTQYRSSCPLDAVVMTIALA